MPKINTHFFSLSKAGLIIVQAFLLIYVTVLINRSLSLPYAEKRSFSLAISPSQGQVLNANGQETKIFFTWPEVKGALSYEWQLKNASDEKLIVDTEHDRPEGVKMLPAGEYLWRWRTLRPAGAFGPWQDFRVVDATSLALFPTANFTLKTDHFPTWIILRWKKDLFKSALTLNVWQQNQDTQEKELLFSQDVSHLKEWRLPIEKPGHYLWQVHPTGHKHESQRAFLPISLFVSR